MKLIIFTSFILFLSCNGNPGNEPLISDTSATSLTDSSYSRSKPASTTSYLWEVNAAKKTMKKNTALPVSNAHVDSLISGLNNGYEKILLEKIALKKDTLQLKLNDSDFLVNQLNAKAAHQYLADVVINLTAIPGIVYVQIDFKPGRNFAPGVWSRKKFPGYIVVQ